MGRNQPTGGPEPYADAQLVVLGERDANLVDRGGACIIFELTEQTADHAHAEQEVDGFIKVSASLSCKPP